MIRVRPDLYKIQQGTERVGLWDHQNTPQKGGFFYFTEVLANRVARKGFSVKILK